MADSNIMVVGSKSSVRRMMAAALDKKAFLVAEVPDYLEALWQMGEFRPDLVIVDEELPFVNGWEACQQIRQTFGIPVIISGSTSGPEVWRKVLAVGADYYLRVPFSPLVFGARVKAILRRYHSRPRFR